MAPERRKKSRDTSEQCGNEEIGDLTWDERIPKRHRKVLNLRCLIHLETLFVLDRSAFGCSMTSSSFVGDR